LRITYVIHSYWPAVGGLETVAKMLSEHLASMGHEVYVITSKYGAKDRPSYEIVNGVHVYRIKAFRPGFPYLTYPLEIPKEVLIRADMVHGHIHNSIFTLKILENAKRVGTKTATYFMSVDAFRDHTNLFVRLLGPIYSKYTVEKALEISDIKLVKSFRDQEILKTRYKEETIYVPDGIHEDLLKMPYMAESFRMKYNLYDPFVVYVGRLHKFKGIDILVRAMALVKKESPELKAVIVGPGDQTPYLRLVERLEIKDKVFFTGYVDETTKVGAIDASLALILPSISDNVEAFSLAISEAWARGKAVIASAVGEIPYRVKHLINGALVPPRDPKALAEMIIKLYYDSDLLKKLSLEGRKEPLLTWDQVVDNLLKIYQKETI